VATSPASGPGGGGGSGLPSQWTEGGHGDVVATVDDTSVVTFEIDALTNQSGNLLTVKDASSNSVFGVNVVGVQVNARDVGNAALVVSAVANQASQVVEVDGIGGGYFLLDKNARPVLAVHAAPADGDLAAGECALWFDQTNGAAKLMIKAKQADGTVKTASVALA